MTFAMFLDQHFDLDFVAEKTWDRVEIATSRLIVKIFPQMSGILKCKGFLISPLFQIIYQFVKHKNMQ